MLSRGAKVKRALLVAAALATSPVIYDSAGGWAPNAPAPVDELEAHTQRDMADLDKLSQATEENNRKVTEYLKRPYDQKCEEGETSCTK
jgi:hypothetical protein